jgi:hypothetical protein
MEVRPILPGLTEAELRGRSGMLGTEQVAIIKGMLARGDRQQDIASHFRISSGRIAEINTKAKFPEVDAAPNDKLPARVGRFIDPNAPVEEQFAQLMEWITRPPENSRVIVMTPELAEHILNNLNHNNRRQRPANIRRFANAMATGQWLLTGDTLKFSRLGYLLDGQNRLRACVRSGKSFKTHAVFGIDDDAFDRIDNNAVRTNPDTFEIAGIPHASIAAPAVRWIILESDRSNGSPPERGRKIENNELRTVYRNRIDADRLTEACRAAKSIGRTLPTGSLAGYLYLFGEKSHLKMERFVRDLIDRKRAGRTLLDKVERLRKQNMGRLNELQINALIIQAWNTFQKGETLTAARLNWDENKEYPTIA